MITPVESRFSLWRAFGVCVRNLLFEGTGFQPVHDYALL